MLRPAATLFAPALAALALGCASDSAFAVQACELNGQPINPDNGSTTAGKTGLMRCRDGEGGPILREQELQHGKFMGVVRYYAEFNMQGQLYELRCAAKPVLGSDFDDSRKAVGR